MRQHSATCDTVGAGWAATTPDWNPAENTRQILRDALSAASGCDAPADRTVTSRQGGPAKVLTTPASPLRPLGVWTLPTAGCSFDRGAVAAPGGVTVGLS